MVIQFNDWKARGYLLAQGHVYTFRTRKRRRVGKDWACITRGDPKFADVNITLIREIENSLFDALKPYVKHSGFGCVAEWVTAITRMNPRGNYSFGYLYHVEVI
jgi:hypothetical protein